LAAEEEKQKESEKDDSLCDIIAEIASNNQKMNHTTKLEKEDVKKKLSYIYENNILY